ncbi:MAG: hypothetical protein NTW10_11430 [Bacteroidetes bacterium]|nr:hypothetical protein [Bacteroidota bacterium]
MKTFAKNRIALILILSAVIMLSNQCKKSDNNSDNNNTAIPNTASGSFNWNAGAGVLTFNWTSSNFKCGGGPSIGTETMTGVVVTSTSLLLGSNNMTFIRSGGTAGDIIGKWAGSDSTTGNVYSLIFSNDSKVYLAVNMIINPCFDANSQHWAEGYYTVELDYNDQNRSATLVTVTGPGISGSKTLTYSTSYQSWNSWTSPSTNVDFGLSPPSPPLTYTFHVTDATGTWTAAATINCFQVPIVTDLLPTGIVTGTPVFSWTGINDVNVRYQVQLSDNNHNRIWESDETSGITLSYGGPALTSGATYNYFVVITQSSSCNSQSLTQGSFTYE